MFKIVPDQLKIAQGWVRCGQCADVFDAQSYLQSERAADFPVDPVNGALEQGSAPAAPSLEPLAEVPGGMVQEVLPARGSATAPMPRTIPRWIAEASQNARAPTPENAVQPDPPEAARLYGKTAGQPHPDHFDPGAWKAARERRQQRVAASRAASKLPNRFAATPTGLQRPTAEDSSTPISAFPDGGDGNADTCVPADGHDGSPDESYVSYDFDDLQGSAGERGQDATAQTPGALGVSPPGEVTFVRKARLDGFWRQRRMRRSLSLLALTLTLALILQGLMKYRDELAALYPPAVPAFEAFCDVAGCVVGPARRIDSLVIDSSTFNKLAIDAYRLGFVLKSTAPIALRLPSIEVTLTDSQDRPLIRRVVAPAQFGADTATVGPLGEVAGVLTMRVAADSGSAALDLASASSSPPAVLVLPVAGYRLLAFYP